MLASCVVKSIAKRAIGALGYRVERIGAGPVPTYDADGLTVFNKQAPFLSDDRFMAAYSQAIATTDPKLRIEWRIAVTCWAATHGARLAGDFVECGVNRGMHSLAICRYLDFNLLKKSFYLFDTFDGIPDDQRSAAERANGHSHDGHYEECFDATRKTFAPFPRAVLIRGKVPDTLASAHIDRVCYLSIDMNIAYPERAAIEFFWPKLSPGAMVVLDDYAWHGYDEQRATMDDFAHRVGTEILTLPTGQGLLAKS